MSLYKEEDLQNYIKLLSLNPQIELVQLPKYKRLYSAYRKLKNSYDNDLKARSIISQIINQQFRPTIITVGTIGAFLFGCHQFYYGDLNKICSPLCMGNLHESEQTCAYQIWIQQKNLKFIRLDKIKSNYAYLFPYSLDYIFTAEDIQLFQESGIEYLQIYKTINSKHEAQSDLLHISQLPFLEPTQLQLPSFPTTIKNLIHNSSLPTLLPIIIILFLLLLFSLLALCYFST